MASKSSSSSSAKKSTAKRKPTTKRPAASTRRTKAAAEPAFPGLETRDALEVARERPEPVDPILAARERG